MRTEGSRYFAVIDPRSVVWKLWDKALGTDVIAVKTGSFSLLDPPLKRWYPIDVEALGPVQLIRVCRALGKMLDVSFEWMFVHAIHMDGIEIPASDVYVCHDPEEGRAYYEHILEKSGKAKAERAEYDDLMKKIDDFNEGRKDA